MKTHIPNESPACGMVAEWWRKKRRQKRLCRRSARKEKRKVEAQGQGQGQGRDPLGQYTIKGFAFSCFASALAEAVTSIDVTKVRLQLAGELFKNPYQMRLRAAVSIAREEGARALWKAFLQHFYAKLATERYGMVRMSQSNRCYREAGRWKSAPGPFHSGRRSCRLYLWIRRIVCSHTLHLVKIRLQADDGHSLQQEGTMARWPSAR